MTTVLTGGVFDMLHVGHIHLLERAASLGDRLVVAVQMSEHVNTVAGKNPPILSTDERVEMVGALRCVDEVTVYGSGTDGAIVRLIDPDILVHGDDWQLQADRSQVLDVLDDLGIELVMLPRTVGVSTTDLRRRVLDASCNA